MTTFSPVDRRQRRDAEVDLAAARAEGDAAVLRHAALGDVELGHDLQAGRDAALDRLRRAGHLVQHAVDPEADAQVVRRRLDVDVRCPLLQGLAEDQVDVLDDRGVLDDRVQVGELGDPGLVGGRGLRGGGLGGERRLPVVAVDAREVLGDLA